MGQLKSFQGMQVVNRMLRFRASDIPESQIPRDVLLLFFGKTCFENFGRRTVGGKSRLTMQSTLGRVHAVWVLCFQMPKPEPVQRCTAWHDSLRRFTLGLRSVGCPGVVWKSSSGAIAEGTGRISQVMRSVLCAREVVE